MSRNVDFIKNRIQGFLQKFGMDNHEIDVNEEKDILINFLYQLVKNSEKAIDVAYICISIEEDGRYIEFSARGLWEDDILKGKDINFKYNLLNYLMLENYKRKLICWSYDDSDGDLTCSSELFISDFESFSYEQFERYLTSLIFSIEDAIPAIGRQLKNSEFAISMEE